MCRVHFSYSCCILTTTNYCPQVQVQNQVKASDSRLNSRGKTYLVASLRLHRVGQAPLFCRCNDSIIDYQLLTFHRRIRIKLMSHNLLVCRVPSSSVLFASKSQNRLQNGLFFYFESSSKIVFCSVFEGTYST